MNGLNKIFNSILINKTMNKTKILKCKLVMLPSTDMAYGARGYLLELSDWIEDNIK